VTAVKAAARCLGPDEYSSNTGKACFRNGRDRDRECEGDREASGSPRGNVVREMELGWHGASSIEHRSVGRSCLVLYRPASR